jgi:hypothetical protein
MVLRDGEHAQTSDRPPSAGANKLNDDRTLHSQLLQAFDQESSGQAVLPMQRRQWLGHFNALLLAGASVAIRD